MAKIEDVTYYDDDTMVKVWSALEASMTPKEATECVSRMQNAGILFRERA